MSAFVRTATRVFVTDDFIDIYEVRPRKDKRDVDLISDALPFGWLWYGKADRIRGSIVVDHMTP